MRWRRSESRRIGRWPRALMIAVMMTAALLSVSALGEELPVVVDEPLELPEINLERAQQALIEMGYLEGKADGLYGPKTADALFHFQEKQGMAPTGSLDGLTMAALEQAWVTHAENSRIQKRLIELGYLSGGADGIFGPRSEQALELFRTMSGLDASLSREDVIAALFAADASALPAAVAPGEKGAAVEALQSALARLGFLEGGIDGIYGKDTAAGVKRFQQHLLAQNIGQAYGVEATGEAASTTLFILYDPEYSSYLSDVGAGDAGNEAVRVVNRLNRLGYMDVTKVSSMDDYALEALKMFQRAAGLEPKDVADRATVAALFSDDAPMADHYVPHAVALGDTGRAVRDLEDALVRTGMMIKLPNGSYDEDVQNAVKALYAYLGGADSDAARPYANDAHLSVEAQAALQNGLLQPVDADRLKKSASAARRVQRRLHTLYYLSADEIDGQMGSKTRKAISAFQAANGLEENGSADAAVQALLFSDDAKPSPLPYRVEISIRDQKMDIYALRDGEYARIKQFVCSTGLKNSTPRGIFLGGFPVNRWHYFAGFNCWAQYSFEVVGNIMIHSVIYNSNDENTLRTGSVDALGSPASHGCIRLQVEDAKWLYENCKRGSLVIVIR